jgi:hypothetical protein
MKKYTIIIATLALAVSIGYATTLKMFKTADNQNNLAQTKQSSRNTSSTSCPDCSALEKEYEVALKEYFVAIDDAFTLKTELKFFTVDLDKVKKLKETKKKHDAILEKLKKCWEKREAYCSGFKLGLSKPTPSTPSTPSTCEDCTVKYKEFLEAVNYLGFRLERDVFSPVNNNKPINNPAALYTAITISKSVFITYKQDWEHCLDLRKLYCEGFEKAKSLKREKSVETKK